MAENNNDSRRTIRNFTCKALKATAKAIILYVAYFLIWTMLLAPASEIIPGIQQMIETFVIIYIALMIVSDLTSGTIFQYFFSVAKALFVIGYLIFSLNGGIFGITFQDVSLMVDLRLFLSIAMLLSLLGLAKSVLQAINYMSEKAEYAPI
jgi:hypothetical protein